MAISPLLIIVLCIQTYTTYASTRPYLFSRNHPVEKIVDPVVDHSGQLIGVCIQYHQDLRSASGFFACTSAPQFVQQVVICRSYNFNAVTESDTAKALYDKLETIFDNQQWLRLGYFYQKQHGDELLNLAQKNCL